MEPSDGNAVRSAELVGQALRLVIGDDLAAVAQGQAELARFMADKKLGEGVRNRMEVIFEELVSTVIRHGFTPGAGQTLHVGATAEGDTLTLTLEDDGPAFNPLNQARPEPFGALEDAKLGGLGIPLVLRLATAVRYERPAETPGAAFQPVNRVIVTVSPAEAAQ